jgi:hypothetical protein
MIVDRWVWTVKLQHRDEFVELLKAEVARSARHATRIYTGNIGPLINTVAMEIEFEDLQDYEELWTEWFADPEAAEYMQRTDELETIDERHEVWTLVDWS